MATTREVKVIINGEEYVSGAAQKAETGLAAFTSKIPGWAQAAAVLTVAWKAISAAIDAVGDFAMESIAKYDQYRAAEVKLGAQAKLTGMSLKELKEIVATAREEFGLGSVAAVDITAAVAKFATGAGASAKATDLMRSALELGASAGMNATQVAEGLSSAFAGNDEWLNRLGLANPSQLWKDYAAATGDAGRVLSDTEQKLAVMTAIMEAGNTVAGVYAERMASGAGAQERLNNRVDEAKIAFGAAIQPIRILVIQGLGALLELVAPLVIGIGKIANIVGSTLAYKFQEARGAVGAVIEVVGKLIGNKDLEAWGKRTEQSAVDARNAILLLNTATKDSGDTAVTAGKKHVKAVEDTTDAVKKADAEYKKSYEALSNWYKLLEASTVSYRKVLDTMQPAVKKAMDKAEVESFNTTLAAAKETADGLVAKMKEHGDLPPYIKPVSDAVKFTADELANAARTTLDFAQAFGKVDDETSRVLNNVINIASSIGRIYAGDVAGGVTGLAAGVASLVAAMSNAENKALIRTNTEALRKLRDEVSGLNLNITGEDFSAAEGVLSKIVPMLAGKSIGDQARMMPEIARMLQEAGLSSAELLKIATELGINIDTDKDGRVNLDQLGLLLDALKSTNVGRVGNSFADQLAFFREGQRLQGNAGTAGGLSGLLDFLRNVGGVSALDGIDASDPAAARQALINLFTQLGNGEGLDAGLLGRLTGSQFSDLLSDIIGQLDGLGGGAGAGPGGDIGGGTVGEGTGGGTVGTPTVSTGQMISDAIAAQTTALEPMLAAAMPFHERIADATEKTAAILMEIRDFLQTLNVTETVDRNLERERAALALERGKGLVY